MWTSRLFWKLFVAYAGLIFAAAVLFAALISERQEQQVLGFIHERLRDDAAMLRRHVAPQLIEQRGESLGGLVRDLAVETNTRMTVIANTGRVLADSQQNPALMELHDDRPEIRQAAETGAGASTHISRTLGIPMSYVALRVDGPNGNPVGFVRVALPLESVQDRVGSMRRLIWVMALAICLVTLGLTYYAVGRITQPVALLTDAAQLIASGDYEHKVYLKNRDELGMLGAAFNRMSDELTRRMQQIREDRELLATVLGSMIEGVLAVDADQRIFFANGAARFMLGLGSDSVEGRPIWEQVRHRAVQEAVHEVFTKQEPVQCEFEIPAATRRTVALHADRLPGQPCPGAVLVLHDITELRRLENLRQEFVANVSHELKTPLSSIKAYVETLLHGAINDPENNIAFLKRIEEQAERLHGLILDLLRLARVESGQESFELTPVSIGDVVASCLREHGNAAASKRIALEMESAHPPVLVLADEEGLRTIVNNLVDNAIKYTHSGGRVRVRWGSVDSVGEFEISDTGIGIARGEQARIFERFYRVDRARSRELGGTGLGLSIVKHLVQAFGGSVAVRSQVGEGSTFIVRLPLA